MFPLGIVFAATESFLPGFAALGWPVVDSSPSWGAAIVGYVLHVFRLSTFFMLSGFFAHMMFHRKGASTYIRERARRLLIPLVIGWLVFVPLIVLDFAWAIYRRTHGPGAEAAPTNNTAVFNLTHLWFLYYLVWLNLVVLGVRWLIIRVDRSGHLRRIADQGIRMLVSSPVGPVILAAPTAIALALLPHWWMWMGIPSPNTSLIPEISSLVAYGTAFSFGWLLQRQSHVMSMWAGRWPIYLGGAFLATFAALYVMRPLSISTVFFDAPGGWMTLAYAIIYASAIWCWMFGLMGVALRYFASESPLWRYLADSSYWVYFAHLPLVLAVQVIVMQLSWHWTVKVLFIVLVSYAILLLAYHYLVRSTIIGLMLNGRRVARMPLRQALFPKRRSTDVVSEAPTTIDNPLTARSVP
jgi:hypothetical protein